MTLLRRVAELNNSGASMLVAARDKEAFKTLQTALTIMEQEMTAASLPSKSTSTSTGSNSTAGTSTTSTTSSWRSSLSSDNSMSSTAANGDATAGDEAMSGGRPVARFCIDTKCSNAIPELKDDRYFIFNQALLVETRDNTEQHPSQPASGAQQQLDRDSDDDDDPRYSQSLVCFYTSVVIYNLALAYHKRGMAAASSSSSTTVTSTNVVAAATGMSNYSFLALSQSLRLYEHCLKIIKSIANYSEDCKMLLYAVSCNLAHLYCRKGDRGRAQELLEGLEEANRLSFQNLLD